MSINVGLPLIFLPQISTDEYRWDVECRVWNVGCGLWNAGSRPV
jgi:hypothetical protein